MSTILTKKTNTSGHKNYTFNIERFDSAMEVAKTCESRPMTSHEFHDRQREKKEYENGWCGVESYAQAMDFLRNGHQETVNSMKAKIKMNINVGGQTKRFKFRNDVQGFSPVVPLALQGVPNCMIDMRMTQIKAKVVDVYYDMTCSCGVSSESIINAGKEILSAIYEMEAQGYRFNLYAVQTYTDGKDADMMVVKVKSSTQPVDLKRISFPLCHTGFFRVVGFDWYSRFPKGKYRCGYGHAMKHEFYGKELDEVTKQLFGNNAVFFSAEKVIGGHDGYVKEVLTNDSKG